MKCFCLVLMVLLIGAVYGEDQMSSRLNVIHRVARSIPEHHEGGRFKRQSLSQLFCVRRCTSTHTIKEDMETLNGGNVPPFLESEGPEKLQQVCKTMDDLRTCVDSCGDFPQKEQAMRPFRIIDYICEDHYDEFIEELPCFRESEPRVSEACKRCGGSEFQKEQEQLLKRYKATRNIFGMLGVLDRLCSSSSCRMECQEPVMEEVCGDDEGSDLINGLARITMEESKNLFVMARIESLFPESCNAIIESEDEDEDSREPNNTPKEAVKRVNFEPNKESRFEPRLEPHLKPRYFD